MDVSYAGVRSGSNDPRYHEIAIGKRRRRQASVNAVQRDLVIVRHDIDRTANPDAASVEELCFDDIGAVMVDPGDDKAAGRKC